MTEVAICCIGDELLDGRVRDANAAYLGRWCTEQGHSLIQIRMVDDQTSRIVDALDDLSDADLVIVSGGLGPTHDDRTREAAATFADDELVFAPEQFEALRKDFQARGRTLTEGHRRQCHFPSTATILPSEAGTAAGFRLARKGTDIYFFPGVPSEFRWFTDHVLPTGKEEPITEQLGLQFFGLGESDLADRLQPVVQDLESRGLKVGFRADFPVLHLSLSGPSTQLEDARQQILSHSAQWLIGDHEESLPQRLGRLLTDDGATVTVAESCTAGGLAAMITSVSGSSRYFHEGFITYSNQAKERLLDVPAELLEAHGAVSAPVVEAMANGARRRSDSTYALAISGIAGPSGATPDKPVGTVYIALSTPNGTQSALHQWPGRSRQQVRTLSVYAALARLLQHLDPSLLSAQRKSP